MKNDDNVTTGIPTVLATGADIAANLVVSWFLADPLLRGAGAEFAADSDIEHAPSELRDWVEHLVYSRGAVAYVPPQHGQRLALMGLKEDLVRKDFDQIDWTVVRDAITPRQPVAVPTPPNRWVISRNDRPCADAESLDSAKAYGKIMAHKYTDRELKWTPYDAYTYRLMERNAVSNRWGWTLIALHEVMTVLEGCEHLPLSLEAP